MDSVPMVDLAAQRRRIEPSLARAMETVIQHGQFILGPEVEELEARLAERVGVPHAIAVSSGTDALFVALLAAGVATGDAIFIPSFTFVATAEVVALLGATPFFVDVLEDTFNMAPDSLSEAVGKARDDGLKPRVVVPVDLFGQPADHDALGEVARAEGLTILADAAQSFGATWRGRPVGSLAEATATSFFPSKPLGCYGDGGAVLTSDPVVAQKVFALRHHGGNREKSAFQFVGMNARMDTIQAAVLLTKLEIFDDELQAREKVARRYNESLAGAVIPPVVANGASSSWAQYTVRVPERVRDAVRQHLHTRGIASAVHYGVPLHQQPPYSAAPRAPRGLPATERLAVSVLSLPMHPYLDAATQYRIVETLIDAVGRSG